MKRHFLRTLVIVLITCLLGGYCYYETDLELQIGLDSLFQMRGERTPPPEVVIVAMDEKSEDDLGVSWKDYSLWRKFHSQLLPELMAQEAKLIIFDLQFIQPQPKVDQEFAAAITKAGNVLVTQCVEKIDYWTRAHSGREQCSQNLSKLPVRTDGREIEKYRITMLRNQPNDTILNASLGQASFSLPDHARNTNVREAATFIARFDDKIVPQENVPTMPVLIWFYYLQKNGALPDFNQKKSSLSSWLAENRNKCLNTPTSSSGSIIDPSGLTKLKDDLLCGKEDTRYLDFYGPPQTLAMFSYSDVYNGKVPDLKNKVVFIGKANKSTITGKTTDVFHTPFTNNDTGQMFGVEIMATQFANLLEGRHIESPLPPISILFIYGLLITSLLCVLPGMMGIVLSLAASLAYAAFALWCFGKNDTWLPVAVPVLIQLPIAGLSTMYWSNRDLQIEIQRILDFVKRVFPDWLPVISGMQGKLKLEHNKPDYSFERDVNGLCLATDIEDYTKVAAQSSPHKLLELLKAYYKVLAQPVKDRKGYIADVAGDAMIAFWINDASSAPQQRLAATLAALDMQAAVSNFNAVHEKSRLPTRIGIHEGEMALGELNAAGSVQYRAIGDTVNAASRIQGVNKYLGTQILASAVIAPCLGDIVYRSVGRFLLVGLSEPIELIEIFSKARYMEISKSDLLVHFEAGLKKFQQERWQEAINIFQYVLNNQGEDGPTQFYLKLALDYQNTPPPEGSGGVITFTNK